jgi:ABC-type Fe3+-hydroxamate transport system substrate-binding protein
MKYDSLKSKIRELAHLLAYEEEAEHKFKDWSARKKEHDYLLNKLYSLEKKA